MPIVITGSKFTDNPNDIHEIITRDNINSIFSITRTNEIGRETTFAEIKSSKYFGLLKIDLGLKEFAICSEGDRAANPKVLQRTEKQLVKAQRELSRKQKGSRNRTVSI